jgi:hypothetical protein
LTKTIKQKNNSNDESTKIISYPFGESAAGTSFVSIPPIAKIAD